jgi:hypothetical protein
MPGAEQSENVPAKGAGEQAIDLIHPPYKRCREASQYLTPQKSTKVGVWAASGIPYGGRGRRQIQLLCERFRYRQQQGVRSYQVRGIKGLKLSECNLRARFPRLL